MAGGSEVIQKRRESWRCRSLIVGMCDAEVLDPGIVVALVDVVVAVVT